MEAKKERFQYRLALIELPYQLFYFAFYAGYMPLLLYLPVYFKYLGLGPVYVGLLNGIRPILQSIGTPLLVMLGEKFRSRKLLFVISCIVMISKVLVIFLLLRPKNQLCTVKYINESSHIIKEKSYFVEHKLSKRSLVTDNWSAPWNWKNAKNDTSHPFTAKKNLYGTKMNWRYEDGGESSITSGNATTFVEKTKKENQTGLNETINPTTDNMSRPTRPKPTKKTNNIKIEYHVVDDDNEVYRIYVGLLIMVFLGDWFDATVFTLVDHSCAATMATGRYGKIRLWGNVGWGVMTPVIGIVIYHFDYEICGKMVGSFHYVFFFFLGFSYIALLVGSHLDFTREPTDSLTQKVHSAHWNFQYGMFLFASAYSGFCNGFFFTFVNWFIDSLGGNALIMGIATGCKCIVDVVLFYLLTRIIDYFGHLPIMSIGFAGHIAVFLIYFVIKNAWLVIIAEIIHAVAYGLMTSTCVSFLINTAPAGSSPRMQAILHGIYWGLGTGSGAIFGGYCLQNVGFPRTFLSFTAITCIVAFVFLVIQLIAHVRNFESPNDTLSERTSEFDGDDEGDSSSVESEDQ